MRNSILIYCEGITDQIFIADCIELFYNIQVDKKIISEKKVEISFINKGRIVAVEGCKNLNQPLYKKDLEDNHDEGGINLIIFDADQPDYGNNGVEAANQKLNDFNKIIPIEFYLWPDNNSNGEIEDLLMILIPQNNKYYFNCLHNFNECISTGHLRIEPMDLKKKINTYIHNTDSSASKLPNRNYKKEEYWNLRAAQDNLDELKKLKVFLDKFFLP